MVSKIISEHVVLQQPLDHRLLAVFSLLYRIEAGAWFQVRKPWLEGFFHPNVAGAMTSMESMDIAWDAQAQLETAESYARKLVFVSYDYEQYFDSFEHQWTAKMLEHVGMPPQVIQLIKNLYSSMQRVIKKGNVERPLFCSQRLRTR